MMTEAADNIIEELYEDDEYRNNLATVDKDGKRIWLYPKKAKGPFFNKRALASLVFLTIFIGGVFVKIGGQPLLMMNIFERKFVIFGQLFLPQDFVLFGLGMIILVLFVTLFTVEFGRIWCGWFCPQTVFMEFIFRPIENWLEGDGRTQKKFDDRPWDFNKIWRKILKHTIYIVFSIIIAHFTMAYIVGIEEVLVLISSSPGKNMSGFIGLVVFTGIFYFVFTKLREQVCIAICPYGRLQGVLVNRDTMTVIYDYVRGEPRGKIKKNAVKEEAPEGDCVDCKLCVQVCPTGIDIRNGIQLECVNCTACIDACDDVMEKVNKPKGLIRYASVESVEKGIPYKFSKRSMAYSAVLVVLVALEALLLIGRSEVETTLMRVPGQLYQVTESGTITNLYNAQMVNKSQEELMLDLRLIEPIGTLKVIGIDSVISIPPGEKREVVFFLEMDKKQLKGTSTKVLIDVYTGDLKMENLKTTFFGPSIPK